MAELKSDKKSDETRKMTARMAITGLTPKFDITLIKRGKRGGKRSDAAASAVPGGSDKPFSDDTAVLCDVIARDCQTKERFELKLTKRMMIDEGLNTEPETLVSMLQNLVQSKNLETLSITGCDANAEKLVLTVQLNMPFLTHPLVYPLSLRRMETSDIERLQEQLRDKTDQIEEIKTTMQQCGTEAVAALRAELKAASQASGKKFQNMAELIQKATEKIGKLEAKMRCVTEKQGSIIEKHNAVADKVKAMAAPQAAAPSDS